ncbi:MAG: hypothetical protein ACI85K_002509, partial [Hyphomicrobiaceae bacterium]
RNNDGYRDQEDPSGSSDLLVVGVAHVPGGHVLLVVSLLVVSLLVVSLPVVSLLVMTWCC